MSTLATTNEADTPTETATKTRPVPVTLSRTTILSSATSSALTGGSRQWPSCEFDLQVALPPTDSEPANSSDVECFTSPRQVKKLRREQAKDERRTGMKSTGARPKSRPTIIRGTRGHCTLRAGPVTRELFVFRVHPDHNEDDIKSFLNDEGVDVTPIERVSSDSSYTHSFHFVIKLLDADHVFKQDFWPDGICCRRFFHRRTQDGSDKHN